MKKTLLLMVLFISTAGGVYSQADQDKFEYPSQYIRHRYMINLLKGNEMKVELTNVKGLAYLRNIDSLLYSFVKDISPLKDSFSSKLNARRIDYLTDSFGTKKIRVRQSPPGSSDYVVNKGELSLLKLAQDTIVLSGITPIPKTGKFSKQPPVEFYRVSFYLNDLDDLSDYMGGFLNEKMSSLEDSINLKWANNNKRSLNTRGNPDITLIEPGNSIYYKEISLSYRSSVDVQNFKNYFVPSFSIGLLIRTSKSERINEYCLSTETHFFFAKNDNGKLKTFTNNFLTLSYEHISSNTPSARPRMYPYISVGYLLKQNGNFYEKNTFKIGLGRVSLFNGSTKIEPGFYLDNFVKGFSPTLRISQYF